MQKNNHAIATTVLICAIVAAAGGCGTLLGTWFSGEVHYGYAMGTTILFCAALLCGFGILLRRNSPLVTRQHGEQRESRR